MSITLKKLREILREYHLDELSKKTLGSYVQKASKDLDKTEKDQSRNLQNIVKGHGGSVQKDRELSKRVFKRHKGLDAAKYRLAMTKEDKTFNKTFTVSNLERIDDVLSNFDHNINGNKVTMRDEDYVKFMKEIKRKNLKL